MSRGEETGAADALDRRQRAAIIAVTAALVAAVVALVSVQAQHAPGVDTAGRQTIDPFGSPAVDAAAAIQTQTSAPRVGAAAAGDPTAAALAADDGAASPSDPSVDDDAGDDFVDGLAASASDVPDVGGLTEVVRRYFGDRTVEAIVIVQCESNFVPTAVGTNTNGTQDHGLFQINDVHTTSFETVTGAPWDARYDPELNTAFAAWLFDHADGWGPWRCNRNLEEYVPESEDGEAPAPEADTPG